MAINSSSIRFFSIMEIEEKVNAASRQTATESEIQDGLKAARGFQRLFTPSEVTTFNRDRARENNMVSHWLEDILEASEALIIRHPEN